jgi:hypothetical protein
MPEQSAFERGLLGDRSGDLRALGALTDKFPLLLRHIPECAPDCLIVALCHLFAVERVEILFHHCISLSATRVFACPARAEALSLTLSR